MANAAAIGYLELNIKGFEQALTAAKRALTVFAAGMAAMKGMEFLKDGVKDAINFGNAMHHASQAAGRMDPGSFLIIQKAMENIGMSAEQAQSSIAEFVREGRPIESIFGNSGNYAKALENATQQYGAQAKVLSENASKFSKVFELLQAVGGKVREFFLSMAAQFLKPLQATLETLNRMDLAKIGAEFGKVFADAVNMLNGAMKNGTVGDIIAAGFDVGVAYLNEAMDKAFELMSAAATLIGVAINAAIVSIDWGNLFKAIYNAMVSGAINFVSLLGKMFTTVIGKVGELMGMLLDKLPGGGSGNFDRAKQWTDSNVNLVDLLQRTARDATKMDRGSLLDVNTSLIGPTIKTAMKEISASLSKLPESKETKEAKAKLAELAAQAQKTGEALAKTAPDKIGGYPGMKADPYSVIADSLAKVGGGGGAMKVGMSIEEKQLFEQKNAVREIIKLQLIMTKKNTGATDLVLPRDGVNAYA